jgi:hypothetical protein
MPAAPIIGAVGAIGGGLLAANASRSASNKAADVQRDAAANAQAFQQHAFDTAQANLSPYRDLGQQGIAGVQGLLGLNGADAQQRAYSALQGSPQYQTLLSEGENAMRQNASATGGLRGGNFQAALQRFRPQLLNSLVDQQYTRLGGLLNTGLNAATGVGQAALQTGNAQAGLANDMGAYQAGGIMGGARANAGLYRDVGGALGGFAQSPAFGNLFGGAGPLSAPTAPSSLGGSYGFLDVNGTP